MPTITEGDSGGPPRGGGAQNGSDPEANFEQLMVNMLDERDKLLESLRETQETLIQSQTKLQGALHERDVLQRQIYAALPQVRENTTHTYMYPITSITQQSFCQEVWILSGVLPRLLLLC